MGLVLRTVLFPHICAVFRGDRGSGSIVPLVVKSMTEEGTRGISYVRMCERLGDRFIFGVPVAWGGDRLRVASCFGEYCGFCGCGSDFDVDGFCE